MVILHYLTEFQRIDTDNYYYIYAMDELQHLKLYNKKWKDITFKYFLKDMRINTRKSWLKLKDSRKAGVFASIKLISLRIIKILIELVDDINYTFKLASSLKKNNIDIYIGSSTYYFPYFFFSKIKKASIIYDLVWKLYPETMEFGNKIRMRFFTMRNMKKIDLLISISENTKKDTHEILNIDTDIEAIPLAADNNIFYKADSASISRIKSKYTITKKYILSVCTLEPRKNLETLLKAYKKMENWKEYQLVLVGMTGWIKSDFFKGLEDSGIYDNIIFTGYVANDDLAPLYTGAEVFVFPSLYEGFGLPVLEAMQCGCPVITSNSSSIPEVIGDAGIMVDAMDTEGLSNEMEKVLRNSTLKTQLSSKGLKRAEFFSWEKSANKFLEKISAIC